MGTFWAVLLVLGVVAPMLALAASVWLVHRWGLRRRRLQPASGPAGPQVGGGRAERQWGTALLFVSTGTFLPWLVGLAVKLYLDSQGRPTLPVSDFTDPRVLPVLLTQTLTLWAFPFLVLASAVVVPWRVGFRHDSTSRESMLPIWLAYAGGVLADLALFVGIFWQFDAIMLIVPLGLFLLPPMTVGYAIGWWVVRRRFAVAS